MTDTSQHCPNCEAAAKREAALRDELEKAHVLIMLNISRVECLGHERDCGLMKPSTLRVCDCRKSSIISSSKEALTSINQTLGGRHD